MSPNGSLHFEAGSLARNGYALDLGPEDAGWTYCSLRIVELAAGERKTFETGEDEVVVLSLRGGADVSVDGAAFALTGRAGVFAGVSDFVYAPIGSTVSLSGARGGRFAIPGARARRRFPARHVVAADIPVEFRGAGICSRQIVNFCTPESFEADRLIACEVFTPAGNWSSFPAHKHDEETDAETCLEEIYYYEVADGPHGAGVGYQRVYGSTSRPIELLAEVRSGDAVLVPHGWHGPTIAMPGYDLYYLNVMAGPGVERAWRISFDPGHAWIRDAWAGQVVDPRLPLVPRGGRR